MGQTGHHFVCYGIAIVFPLIIVLLGIMSWKINFSEVSLRDEIRCMYSIWLTYLKKKRKKTVVKIFYKLNDLILQLCSVNENMFKECYDICLIKIF